MGRKYFTFIKALKLKMTCFKPFHLHRKGAKPARMFGTLSEYLSLLNNDDRRRGAAASAAA